MIQFRDGLHSLCSIYRPKEISECPKIAQNKTLDSLQMNNVKMVLTIVSQIALNKITDSVIRLLLVLRLYNISLVDRAPLLFR